MRPEQQAWALNHIADKLPAIRKALDDPDMRNWIEGTLMHLEDVARGKVLPPDHAVSRMPASMPIPADGPEDP